MQYARGESNIKVGAIQRQQQAHIQWCCCRFRADGHHSLVAIHKPHHQNQHLKHDRQRHKQKYFSNSELPLCCLVTLVVDDDNTKAGYADFFGVGEVMVLILI